MDWFVAILCAVGIGFMIFTASGLAHRYSDGGVEAQVERLQMQVDSLRGAVSMSFVGSVWFAVVLLVIALVLYGSGVRQNAVREVSQEVRIDRLEARVDSLLEVE